MHDVFYSLFDRKISTARETNEESCLFELVSSAPIDIPQDNFVNLLIFCKGNLCIFFLSQLNNWTLNSSEYQSIQWNIERKMFFGIESQLSKPITSDMGTCSRCCCCCCSQNTSNVKKSKSNMNGPIGIIS